MTRLNPALTSFKTLDITYQTPQETLLATPEALPTSEPSTPQIGYTVQSSHLPTFSIGLYKVQFMARIFGAGKFVTAGTLYWRMKKNGASVASGSASVAANTFYTVSAQFRDINTGDVLELALWSSVSDSNWDYKAAWYYCSRFIPLKTRLLKDVYVSGSQHPTLTLGNPGIAQSFLEMGKFYHLDTVPMNYVGSPASISLIYAGGTYGFFAVMQDISSEVPGNSAVVLTHASYKPYYRRSNQPVQVKFRGIRLD